MGGLLSLLLTQGPGTSSFKPIRVGTLLSEEDLVAETMQYVGRALYRDKIYVADFYRELDQRVPETEEDSVGIVWRMNVDHPLVYVLVAELGQQPIHVIDDFYGEIVAYGDAEVQEGVQHLVSLCSAQGYTIYNEPEEEPSGEAPQVEDKKEIT